MSRGILLVLIALWLCLIAITGVNLYRQQQLVKLQGKILSDYKYMSEIPDLFAAKRDSIQRNITLAEQMRKESGQPFPLKNAGKNWLLLRITALVMTLVTIVVYWLHFKRKPQEA